MGEKIKLIDTGDGSDPPGPVSAIVLVSEDFNCGFNLFTLFFGLFTALELLHGALDQKADTEMQDRQPLLPFFLDWRRSKKHLKRLVLGLFLDIKHIDKRSMLPSSFPLKP